jgi:hypothetical protein
MIRNRSNRRRVPFAVVVGVVAGFLAGFHAYGAEMMTCVKRADVVFIDALSEFGPLERQPVAFEHDLHTQALQKQNKDCGTCHLVDERGFLSQRFERLEDGSKGAVLNIYHDNCTNCHIRTAESGARSGPLTCGGCHPKRLQVLSSIEPMGFDLSLHYRHIEASNGKCEACHHQYDEVKRLCTKLKGKRFRAETATAHTPRGTADQ